MTNRKSLIKAMITITIATILAGCVSTTKEIASRANSTRTDVFVEVQTEGIAPAGFVDLAIKASVKSHLEGYSASGSKTPAPGNPGYPFLVNIDGQAVLWTADGQAETTPFYDEDGYLSLDPDAGTGGKYRLEKKIRLAVGPHKILFGLPNQGYLSAFKVFLNDGESHMLEFKPQYGYKTKKDRVSTFRKGIEKYEAVLNKQVVGAVISSYSSYGFKTFLPDF